MNKVKVGMRFRSCYADSNPLWEVKRSRGQRAWECEIVNEPFNINGKLIDSDWAGTRKLFDSSEILRSVDYEKSLKQSLDESDEFYKNNVGQIVHYHNGFGAYVRCEVVDEECKGLRPSLKPIALVGKWQSYDLPRRRPDGIVDHGYYANMMLEKTLFHPHVSNIYEFPQYSRQNTEPNPKNLPPIDLSLPPMSPKDEQIAKQWQLVHRVHSIINSDCKNPEQIINRIKKLVTV
jgi:hypothetical protein